LFFDCLNLTGKLEEQAAEYSTLAGYIVMMFLDFHKQRVRKNLVQTHSKTSAPYI
jgi:hypothetical protein